MDLGLEPLPAVKINPSIALSDAVGQRAATVAALLARDIPGIVTPLIPTGGTLGPRVGRFQSNGSVIVRAPICLLSGTFTDDNAAEIGVTRVGGPYADGTSYWRLSADTHFPTRQYMNCFFNGPAGDFAAVGFNNYSNQSSGGYWEKAAGAGYGSVWTYLPPGETCYSGEFGSGCYAYPGYWGYVVGDYGQMRRISFSQTLDFVTGVNATTYSYGGWQAFNSCAYDGTHCPSPPEVINPSGIS